MNIQVNVEALKIAAAEMRFQINAHLGKSEYVSQLAQVLEPLLEKAENKLVNEPINIGKVPGEYFFTEYGLRKFEALDKAYAGFFIQLVGAEDFVKTLESNGQVVKSDH